MKKITREGKITTEELNELEKKLQISLGPVQPDPQFITRLQTRLSTPATVVLEDPVRSGAFLIIAMGLFLGALLVWLLQRLR
jgi:hypothetical protein